ncbi:MAG: DUF4349 domain-containing protein [Armatimonadota bacterium]
MSEQGKRGVKVVHVVLAVVAILLVVFVVAVFRAAESKRTQYVPGAGVIGPEGKPVMAARHAYGGAGGMARGGARGGGGIVEYSRGGGEMGGELPADEYAPVEQEGPPQRAPGFEAVARSAVAKNLMVIYTGSMRLRVESVKTAHDAVARIAREAGGYVSESSFSSEQGPAYATITIRVPSLGLGKVIDRIAALATKLLDQQLGSEEVTQEYVDLTSRKRNLEREEERLLELLKRAGKIRDLLEVEQTVARVRGEIETIAGRMRYLEDRVAYSTLTVTLEGPQPALTTGGPVWTAKDVWREAVRSLRETGRALATMGIWIAVFIPVWVPLLLVLKWLAKRAFPTETK